MFERIDATLDTLRVLVHDEFNAKLLRLRVSETASRMMWMASASKRCKCVSLSAGKTLSTKFTDNMLNASRSRAQPPP